MTVNFVLNFYTKIIKMAKGGSGNQEPPKSAPARIRVFSIVQEAVKSDDAREPWRLAHSSCRHDGFIASEPLIQCLATTINIKREFQATLNGSDQ